MSNLKAEVIMYGAMIPALQARRVLDDAASEPRVDSLWLVSPPARSTTPHTEMVPTRGTNNVDGVAPESSQKFWWVLPTSV